MLRKNIFDRTDAYKEYLKIKSHQRNNIPLYYVKVKYIQELLDLENSVQSEQQKQMLAQYIQDYRPIIE